MKKITFVSLVFALILSVAPSFVSAQTVINGNLNSNTGTGLSVSDYPAPTLGTINPSASGLSACQALNGFQAVANCALGIINLIIPIIVAVTVVWTIYSSFELARTEGDDRKKWGMMIFYGLLGIFLMISIYGLVAIFTGTFGFGGNTVTVPNINSAVKLGN